MKKSLIALAVVASTVAGASNTTLWGSVRMEYKYDGERETTMLGDSGSRFGIMGEEELGNGMTAFYAYENRIKTTHLETNKLYVGLKGGFGSISFGYQPLPNDSLGNYSDPFNSLSTVHGPVSKDKLNNSAVYWSPDMDGFQAGLGITMDGKPKGSYDSKGKGTDNDHVDFVDVVAKYEANGLFAGLGYQQKLNDADGRDKTAAAKVVSLGLGYKYDMFEVGLRGDIKVDRDDKKNPYVIRLGGLYTISDADSVYAGFGFEDKDNGSDEQWDVSLGYQHNFSKRTRVWAEYNYQDNGKKLKGSSTLNEATDQVEDGSTVSLGLRTDF